MNRCKLAPCDAINACSTQVEKVEREICAKFDTPAHSNTTDHAMSFASFMRIYRTNPENNNGQGIRCFATRQ